MTVFKVRMFFHRYDALCLQMHTVLTMSSYNVPPIHSPPPLPHHPPIFANTQDLTPYISNSLSVFRAKHSRTPFFHLPYPPPPHHLPTVDAITLTMPFPIHPPPPPPPRSQLIPLKKRVKWVKRRISVGDTPLPLKRHTWLRHLPLYNHPPLPCTAHPPPQLQELTLFKWFITIRANVYARGITMYPTWQVLHHARACVRLGFPPFSPPTHSKHHVSPQIFVKIKPSIQPIKPPQGWPYCRF